MRLPTPLLRNNKKAHKNVFGHALIIAGSPNMLGASALAGLACMRSGAGLVTIAIPKSLILIIQKKIAPVIMTMGLPETRAKTISVKAIPDLKKSLAKYQAVAIGPGLTVHPSTQNFIHKIIEASPVPLVIDADALSAVSKNLKCLVKTNIPKILTPHPGEMARLTGKPKTLIEKERTKIAREFAQKNQVTLVLKGHHTVVASQSGQIYLNKTGNTGMATAGSGDVLTGMITAFVAQGIKTFEAAQWAVYLHGKAGDEAAKVTSKPALLATDIIECIPLAFKKALKTTC